METDAETLLWYAVRHTAGEPTAEVVQVLRRMWPNLDANTRRGLRVLIDERLDVRGLIGQDVDDMWVQLVEELDGE